MKKDNIKMDLKEIGCSGCGLDASGSEWVIMACSCEHYNEDSVHMKFVKFLDEING